MYPEETIAFCLFSCTPPPTDTQDLLFLPSEEEMIDIKIKDDFYHGLELIRKNYACHISQIYYNHYWGSLLSTAEHLVETKEIDLLVISLSKENNTKHNIELTRIIEDPPCPLLLIPGSFSGFVFDRIGFVVELSGYDGISDYERELEAIFPHDKPDIVFITLHEGALTKSEINNLSKAWEEAVLYDASFLLIKTNDKEPGAYPSELKKCTIDLLLFKNSRETIPFFRKDHFLQKVGQTIEVPVMVIPSEKKHFW
jgi:hypothetical protein